MTDSPPRFPIRPSKEGARSLNRLMGIVSPGP